jgi:7,8-dihydroneopterin aldolase/epimerase/oxygenase
MPGPDEGGDAIHIEELELKVRIGVPDDERAQVQRLTVSITLWPRTSFDALEDRIEVAVDYATVVREVQKLAVERTDKLIETLAEAIASHLLATYPIARVRVELRKFILPGVKHVAAILTRERAHD